LKYLKKYFRIEEIDELAFPSITPHSKPLVVIHPYFFIMIRASKQISRKLHRYGGFIGIDVCDSDHISRLAVSTTNYAHTLFVPSNFCREVYVRSGVKTNVDVLPHGLDPEFFVKPRNPGQFFGDLLKFKQRHNLKFILFYLWHSEYRKGWDLVFKFYNILRKERKDAILVLKTATPNGPAIKQCKQVNCINVAGWLSEDQKIELYDLADIYPLFSRGGGFELNGLEALARNVVVLAAAKGPWTDYLPGFSLIEYRICGHVLKDNPIHDGRGFEVVVEKAVDKAHEILDNLDDYRARVREFVDKHIVNKFSWPRIIDEFAHKLDRIREELGLKHHVII